MHKRYTINSSVFSIIDKAVFQDKWPFIDKKRIELKIKFCDKKEKFTIMRKIMCIYTNPQKTNPQNHGFGDFFKNWSDRPSIGTLINIFASHQKYFRQWKNIFGPRKKSFDSSKMTFGPPRKTFGSSQKCFVPLMELFPNSI